MRKFADFTAKRGKMGCSDAFSAEKVRSIPQSECSGADSYQRGGNSAGGVFSVEYKGCGAGHKHVVRLIVPANLQIAAQQL